MTTLHAALITKNPGDIPAWVAPAAAEAGLVLTVRRCETHDELVRYAGSAEVLWTVGANTCLTADILPRLPRCRAIMRSGSGLDDLPVAAARARGLLVANTPEAIAETVAEHAVALLFALVRQVARHDHEVRGGAWNSEPTWARWHLRRQTLGLVGFGLIAREVVSMLAGFRMTILVHDPFTPEAAVRAHGAEPVTLEELLLRSDFVSLHCPLTNETRNLLGAEQFAHMKPNALLVNTARGDVVDEAALIEALRAGTIAGAALDVLAEEPPAPDNPLLKMENVLLTPHIAAFSDEFERKFWEASIAKLVALRTQLEAQT
jgi:D-3-phosphoglycerate dehydrogenase